jgi:hypothetical protein
MSHWWWVGAGAVSVSALALFLTVGCNPPAEVVRDEALRALHPGADTVVVVYSRSGNTARAARAFADELGADFIRLQGQGGEGDSWLKTPSWRRQVAVRPPAIDLRPYRRVILASPIWYWRPTAIAMSFAGGNDFGGKEVLLLYTCEGGVWRSGLDGWKARVEARGGRVVQVLGIDRKHLAKGETVETRARALARELK